MVRGEKGHKADAAVTLEKRPCISLRFYLPPPADLQGLQAAYSFHADVCYSAARKFAKLTAPILVSLPRGNGLHVNAQDMQASCDEDAPEGSS